MMGPERAQLISALFDEYIEMYASRDDRLSTMFSENFSGYTGGGSNLVKDRDEWIRITRQDFSQVTGRIGIEMLDLSMQDISEDVVAVTAFFHIHLPIPDAILSRETARLVLIYRFEGQSWKIVHSGISIPYGLVGESEVYPIKGLLERNRELGILVKERTQALEEANQKLDLLNGRDGLTEIANRRKFDTTLAQEWSRAQRSGTSLSLVMLDVDYFKEFNDHYGHPAGDECLKALARALTRSGLRTGQFVARYGGEEFAVLLPSTTETEVMEVARRIQKDVWSLALTHPCTTPGIVTFSLGVASMVPAEFNVPEQLLNRADLALYRAKHAGRNCIQ